MDLGMDMWKYYGITHTDHTVMNPLSLEKTRELVGLLRLPEGGGVPFPVLRFPALWK